MWGRFFFSLNYLQVFLPPVVWTGSSCRASCQQAVYQMHPAWDCLVSLFSPQDCLTKTTNYKTATKTILTDLKLQKLREMLGRIKQAVSWQFCAALLSTWKVILNLPGGCWRGVCILVQIKFSFIAVLSCILWNGLGVSNWVCSQVK